MSATKLLSHIHGVRNPVINRNVDVQIARNVDVQIAYCHVFRRWPEVWKCGKRGVCAVCGDCVVVFVCIGGGGRDQHVVAFGF